MAFTKKVTFSKSNLTTNLETLVNLEPSFGVMLEIKTIPNYLHGHTVSTVRLIWLIYWNKFGKKECELEVLILTGPKKCQILQRKKIQLKTHFVKRVWILSPNSFWSGWTVYKIRHLIVRITAWWNFFTNLFSNPWFLGSHSHSLDLNTIVW